MDVQQVNGTPAPTLVVLTAESGELEMVLASVVDYETKRFERWPGSVSGGAYLKLKSGLRVEIHRDLNKGRLTKLQRCAEVLSAARECRRG